MKYDAGDDLNAVDSDNDDASDEEDDDNNNFDEDLDCHYQQFKYYYLYHSTHDDFASSAA